MITQKHFSVPFQSIYPVTNDIDDPNILFGGTGANATISTDDPTTLGLRYTDGFIGGAVFIYKPSITFIVTPSFYTLEDTITGDDGVLYIPDYISKYSDWSVTLTSAVSKIDSTIQAWVVGDLFEMPMWDEGYTVDYDFSKISRIPSSLKTFINYDTIRTNSLRTTYNYKWSGLIEAQKNEFVGLIESFRNSFQPFYILELNDDNDNFTTYFVMIDSNSVTITKDKADLYTVSLSLIDMNVEVIDKDDTPVPDTGTGFGFNFGNDWGSPSAWA